MEFRKEVALKAREQDICVQALAGRDGFVANFCKDYQRFIQVVRAGKPSRRAFTLQ